MGTLTDEAIRGRSAPSGRRGGAHCLDGVAVTDHLRALRGRELLGVVSGPGDCAPVPIPVSRAEILEDAGQSLRLVLVLTPDTQGTSQA